MPVTLQEKVQNHVELRIVEAPNMQVGWTLNNGRLIIGFSADAVVKAATAPPAGKGLDQNEKFAALSKQSSGGKPIRSFRFMDLPVTAPVMNDYLKEQWQMISMFASQQGIDLPEDPFPPIDVVKAHIAPSAEVSWVTDAGFYSRSRISFPGADMYSNQPDISRSQVGGTALMVSILLPSLNRARETANRVKCASNERQIGQAMLLYSNDHTGEYPPDLGTLILKTEISPEVFVCPSSDNALPPNAKQMTPEQMAEWVNKHASYIYAGKGLKNNSPAEGILLIEKLDNHDHDGINCMFGDGHVEFVLPTEPNWRQVQELMKQGK
jgi:prepilin-type processing-associated H-X9-DG protein